MCVWVCVPKNVCSGFSQLCSHLFSILTQFSEITFVHSDASKTWSYKTKRVTAAAAVLSLS